MPRTITVSAPGKLMLFGEHAVVYGRPCIVTAVNQRLKLKAIKLDEPIFQLDAEDVGITNYKKPLSEVGIGEIPRGAKFVEVVVANFLVHIRRHSGKSMHPEFEAKPPVGCHSRDSTSQAPLNDKKTAIRGVKIQTVSQFKSVFGFGSSSASAVCTIKALSELFKVKLSNKQIFDLCYKTVLDIQGVGSGFDLAAAIYGGTLYYVTGGKVIKPLKVKSIPLVVGYSGVKADTPTIVKQVAQFAKGYPKIVNNLYDQMEVLVDMAKKALEKNDLISLGQLMNFNQGYLDALGVNSKILTDMIYSARDAGAYGAKLSGAGVGDCMIAIAPPSKKRAVEKAIEKAGGQVLNVEVNAEGVRLEGESMINSYKELLV